MELIRKNNTNKSPNIVNKPIIKEKREPEIN